MSIQPRPDQVAALAHLMAAFSVHDRVQLVLPCGQGKTLLSRWHAEAAGAKRVVVFAPSRPLVAQIAREWRRVHSAGWRFDALVVCSDPSTPAGVDEIAAGGGVLDEDWRSVRARATTDPGRVARFLRAPRQGRVQVIFATYHSAPTVAAAVAATGTVFDLAVCDEAHRLAGTPNSAFRYVLDARSIVATKRLFMTATPRLTSAEDGYSMDDPAVFGPVAHQVSFGAAIEAGLLCDYEVHVLASGTNLDGTTAAPAAVLDAAGRLGCSTVLSFHGRVAKAQAFADALDGTHTSGGRAIAARCLSGAMPARQREEALAWFGQRDPHLVKLVTNARLLGEGVDVPAVDAICFSDQRSSVIDIVQAVGRVLRPHPDKPIARILVPVTLDEQGDEDTELGLSPFSVLWTVLRALRAHDHRFAIDVDQAARRSFHSRGVSRRRAAIRQVQFHLPAGAGPDEETVWLRLLSEVSDTWEQHYAATADWAWRHAGRRMPRDTRDADGRRLGAWVAKQRQAHSCGLLTQERADLLEAIPGWAWDASAAAFDDTIRVLRAFADAYGDVRENPTGASRFDGLYAAAGVGRSERLWVWLARQRQAYREGSLPLARQQRLEELPGWEWEPVPASDLRMVDALAQFVAFEHHAQVPDGHVEDGLPLGSWVWRVRKEKLWGRLHPALEAEIVAATPSQWAQGSRIKWLWEKPETQWRIAYTALRTFTAREGHAAPAMTTTERLEGVPVRIGQWVSLQRHQHGKGELDERKVELLERLPGWVWVGNVGGTVPIGDPIDLPGTLRHGTAGAIKRRCPCGECRAASRARDREFNAKKRAALDEQGVPAEPVRQHLVVLERKIAAAFERTGATSSSGRTLIAHTSGVTLGEVRRIVAGAERVSVETRARLLATTAELCLRNGGQDGSRGRYTQRGTVRIDAGPTMQLVADLERRGFNRGWIGRELGYRGSLQLAGDRCTKAMAERIAGLHRQVGSMVAPKVRHATAMPTLNELLRQQTSAA